MAQTKDTKKIQKKSHCVDVEEMMRLFSVFVVVVDLNTHQKCLHFIQDSVVIQAG